MQAIRENAKTQTGFFAFRKLCPIFSKNQLWIARKSNRRFQFENFLPNRVSGKTHCNQRGLSRSKSGMNKRYVIQWKSRVNGRCGRGTKLFEQEEANNLVEELNREFPQIEHQAVESPSENSEPESAPTSEPALSVA